MTLLVIWWIASDEMMKPRAGCGAL